MSGTAYGTVTCTSSRSAAGGPLALVENGTRSSSTSRNEGTGAQGAPASSRAARKPEETRAPLARGYWRLYFDHVLQANDGADLDFWLARAAPSSRVTTTDQEHVSARTSVPMSRTKRSTSRAFAFEDWVAFALFW